MAAFEKEVIERVLSETNLRLRAQEAVNRRAESEMDSLSSQINLTKENISSLELRQRLLCEALIVLNGVPKKVAALREKILEKMRRVERKDILVKTCEDLIQKIGVFKTNLQHICHHPFVMETQTSYEGSSTMDYEDNHPGARLCVVCGFLEHSAKTIEVTFLQKEDVYPTLNKIDTRIIKWAGAVGWKVELHGWTNANLVWQPLEEFIEKYFIDKRLRHIIGSNDQHLNVSATQQNK